MNSDFREIGQQIDVIANQLKLIRVGNPLVETFRYYKITSLDPVDYSFNFVPILEGYTKTFYALHHTEDVIKTEVIDILGTLNPEIELKVKTHKKIKVLYTFNLSLLLRKNEKIEVHFFYHILKNPRNINLLDSEFMEFSGKLTIKRNIYCLERVI